MSSDMMRTTLGFFGASARAGSAASSRQTRERRMGEVLRRAACVVRPPEDAGNEKDHFPDAGPFRSEAPGLPFRVRSLARRRAPEPAASAPDPLRAAAPAPSSPARARLRIGNDPGPA